MDELESLNHSRWECKGANQTCQGHRVNEYVTK